MKLLQTDHSQANWDWAPTQQWIGRTVVACQGQRNLPLSEGTQMPPLWNEDVVLHHCNDQYIVPFTRQTTILWSAEFLLLFPISFFTCIIFLIFHPSTQLCISGQHNFPSYCLTNLWCSCPNPFSFYFTLFCLIFVLFAYIYIFTGFISIPPLTVLFRSTRFTGSHNSMQFPPILFHWPVPYHGLLHQSYPFCLQLIHLMETAGSSELYIHFSTREHGVTSPKNSCIYDPCYLHESTLVKIILYTCLVLVYMSR